MILIQSYLNNKEYKNCGFEKNVYEQAKLSVKFLKKHGYDVILFTDNKSLDKISDYNDIKIIDTREYVVHPKFWSSGKLISCLHINEPYIHIDIDLFLIENIISDYLKEDFFCLHNEPNITQIFNPILPNISTNIIKKTSLDIKNIVSKNMAIFGGNPKKINPLIKNVLDTSKDNAGEIDFALYRIEGAENDWKYAVFHEQILLTNSLMIKPNTIYNFPQDYNSIKQRQTLKSFGIDHLWIEKQRIENTVGIQNYIKKIETEFL